MTVRILESAGGARAARWSVAIATGLFLAFCVTSAQAGNTGCTAIYTAGAYKDPNDAPNIECTTLPGTPCPPDACTWSAATGSYGAGCGALTKCVLQGEDPPMTNPAWDETDSGMQGISGVEITGKCGPPGVNNLYVAATAPANYSACSASGPCYPVPNCPLNIPYSR